MAMTDNLRRFISTGTTVGYFDTILTLRNLEIMLDIMFASNVPRGYSGASTADPPLPVGINMLRTIMNGTNDPGSKFCTLDKSFTDHEASKAAIPIPQILPFEHNAPNAVYDLIAVGFGPASLAIAVAIYDEIEQHDKEQCESTWNPKLKFLERQASFGWHSGMLLPGTKMQIAFIKDLATMRNPRSRFTFLNYLKEHNRLVQFSNLNSFLPLRLEFEDYLKWSAGHFNNMVQYSQNVLYVRPMKTDSCEKYNCLEVVSQDPQTGVSSVHHGRNIVIAIGGQPYIPSCFTSSHKRIIHSSQYNFRIADLLPAKDKPYSLAVVGAGQSAAEIFLDLQTRYPNAEVCMLIRDTALRPSDDSPFVNEVFNPDEIDSFFSSKPNDRSLQLIRNRATNYSVVRLELLEDIYARMYQQRLREPDPSIWQHRILPQREIIEVIDVPQCKRLNLITKNLATTSKKSREVLNVDAVILATGYTRNAHQDMLRDCQVINSNNDQTWAVDREYRVKLNRDFASEDIQIYLQGCNEQTHGLSDTLLSNLAIRGGEMLKSIFGRELSEAARHPKSTIQQTNGIGGGSESIPNE